MEAGPSRREPQRPQGHLQFNPSFHCPSPNLSMAVRGGGAVFPWCLCARFLVFAWICFHLFLCQSLSRFYLALKSVAESACPPRPPMASLSWGPQEAEAGTWVLRGDAGLELGFQKTKIPLPGSPRSLDAASPGLLFPLLVSLPSAVHHTHLSFLRPLWLVLVSSSS